MQEELKIIIQNYDEKFLRKLFVDLDETNCFGYFLKIRTEIINEKPVVYVKTNHFKNEEEFYKTLEILIRYK